MKILSLISSIIFISSISLANSTDYVKKVNKLLHEKEDLVAGLCLGDTDKNLVVALDPKKLTGEAAKEYSLSLKMLELEPGDDPESFGLTASILKIGPHTLQVVSKINDGNGSCIYFTKYGKYINYISGSESSEWILRDN